MSDTFIAEALELPFTGLDTLSAIELAVVKTAFEGDENVVQTTTFGNRSNPRGFEYIVQVDGEYSSPVDLTRWYKVSVNENMNVDGVDEFNTLSEAQA